MRSKKVILQINAVYGYGSTGEITRDISAVVLEHGWESYVACKQNSSNNTKETAIIKIGNSLDYKVHAICSRLFGLQGYFSCLQTILFLKKIKAINPDVIHIHNIHKVSSNFSNGYLSDSY